MPEWTNQGGPRQQDPGDGGRIVFWIVVGCAICVALKLLGVI